jgi:hypothetical protein
MHHPYTIYDKSTGEILRSGVCSNPADVQLQVQEGESLLAGVRGHDIDQVVNHGTKRLNKRPAAQKAKILKTLADHLVKAEGIAPLYAKLLAELRR